MASPYQRELLKELEPMGFEPQGYGSDGSLVMTHPIGYSIAVHSTPSDHRSKRNDLAAARRGVKRMEGAGPQFQLWLWEKYKVPEGDVAELQISVTTEIRSFFAERGIDQGASTNAVKTWIKGTGQFRLKEPETRGRGPHVYLVERPHREFEIVEELSAGEIVEPISITEPEMAAPVSAQEFEAEQVRTRIEEKPTDAALIPHDLIRQLQGVFTGPLEAQLKDRMDRLQLVEDELETLDSQLAKVITEATIAREAIMSLLTVLKG